MIGAAQIAAMPAGSMHRQLRARGAGRLRRGLRRAATAGHLFGAAFDVFAEEPIPPDSRLLPRPNIVMTPHLAGASRQTAANAAASSPADVGRYLRGEPPAHCANPAVLRSSNA